jgi:hypothetical protein
VTVVTPPTSPRFRGSAPSCRAVVRDANGNTLLPEPPITVPR